MRNLANRVCLAVNTILNVLSYGVQHISMHTQRQAHTAERVMQGLESDGQHTIIRIKLSHSRYLMSIVSIESDDDSRSPSAEHAAHMQPTCSRPQLGCLAAGQKDCI